MRSPLVLTLIGPDRPGLVELVARQVAAHGGNWLESRMCRLGGQFAGILRLEAPAERQEALAHALGELGTQGLSVVVRTDLPPSAPAAPRVARLELVGQDRPGIVREVSAALAGRGVNVEELSTECSSAPMSGETLFRAQARLRLPAGGSLEELRAELQRVASDLLVEVSLEPLD
jgi:glycine cleavage system regulatory protein